MWQKGYLKRIWGEVQKGTTEESDATWGHEEDQKGGGKYICFGKGDEVKHRSRTNQL